MIAMIAAGVGFILLLAIAVGIIDAARAPEWRRVAAQRRRDWEARHAGRDDVDLRSVNSWSDD